MTEVRHIVALSGGKDSTAMALRLSEVEPRDYSYVCTPTGDELPEMIDHWLSLGKRLGKKILPVTCGVSLHGLINREKMLPNHRARFCTRMLKLEPYYRWLGEQKPCVSYVGLRGDEEGRAGMSFKDDDGITMRFPMREWGWSESDVWAYLEQKDIKIPARTDCARCYHQTLGEWWRLWKMYPRKYAAAEYQEIQISEVWGKRYTLRSEQRDTWPADLSGLRREFESGRVPRNTVQQLDAFGGETRRSMRSGACRVCSL
jgi:hypothetical protein